MPASDQNEFSHAARPYLLRHATDPMHWRLRGEAALLEAKALRPLARLNASLASVLAVSWEIQTAPSMGRCRYAIAPHAGGEVAPVSEAGPHKFTPGAMSRVMIDDCSADGRPRQ
jgi:hypothetical protein